MEIAFSKAEKECPKTYRKIFDAEDAMKQPEYADYLSQAAELSKVDLSCLDQKSMKAFFINIY